MEWTRYLPTINASLNSISAIFIVLGYFFIKKRDITKHKISMLVAFTSSFLFLISYLLYHFYNGSKKFEGEGLYRIVYFSILISHTILATVMLPFIIQTLISALYGNFQKHKAIAKKTLPIWLYVSITGVVIYAMLYHLFYKQ